LQSRLQRVAREAAVLATRAAGIDVARVHGMRSLALAVVLLSVPGLAQEPSLLPRPDVVAPERAPTTAKDVLKTMAVVSYLSAGTAGAAGFVNLFVGVLQSPTGLQPSQVPDARLFFFPACACLAFALAFHLASAAL
jgi:hypothetical protein